MRAARDHEIKHGGGTEPLHDAVAMDFDRLLRCVQFRRSLFVQKTHNNEAQNFELTRRQFVDDVARLAADTGRRTKTAWVPSTGQSKNCLRFQFIARLANSAEWQSFVQSGEKLDETVRTHFAVGDEG
jgi:hypothetical protein